HHRLLRVLALEQPGARVVQAVLHGELDLDDVLVLGQHRRFLEAGGADHVVAADVDRADLRHVDDLVALDRVRQPPVEAGAHGGAVASEARDDRLLAFLHDEDAGAHPDHHHHDRDQAGAHPGALHVGLEVAVAAAAEVAAAAPAPAAEQAPELAVEVAPQFVEVGRPLVRALAVAAVAVAIAAVTVVVLVFAASPAWIVQVEHAPDA